jgi:hypothetical protein
MGALSRYWKMFRINPTHSSARYEQYLVPRAQDFCEKAVSPCQNDNVESNFYSYFYAKKKSVDPVTRALAGLCLRCYVSDPILKACRKIDSLFGTQENFTYQDLLPFVLNDDGETLVVLDTNQNSQCIVDQNGQLQPLTYKLFSVKVLQTYKPDSQSKMSLDNWTYLQTKQNPELKEFLSEFGFKHLSDWALLNRARVKQLERLSPPERHIVEVFHGVYRRDRQQKRSLQAGRCPDPSNEQLQEMLTQLQQRDVVINSTLELVKQLKQIVIQLRRYDIWSYREPLEIQDPDGNYTPRPDLPNDSIDELDVEEQEVLEFLHEHLKLALAVAIEQEVQASISKLEKSKKYAPLAKQFLPGLHLYYCQGMSLKEIAPQLGMTSWDQARRVLNPGELLSKVRTLTIQQLLDQILHKAHDMGLTKIPPEPDYLKSLAEQLEAYVDEEIFTQAAEEIRAGKNRTMSSAYAEALRSYLKNINK